MLFFKFGRTKELINGEDVFLQKKKKKASNAQQTKTMSTNNLLKIKYVYINIQCEVV